MVRVSEPVGVSALKSFHPGSPLGDGGNWGPAGGNVEGEEGTAFSALFSGTFAGGDWRPAADGESKPVPAALGRFALSSPAGSGATRVRDLDRARSALRFGCA